MKITKRWLEKHGACEDAMVWYESKKNKDATAILNAIIREKQPLGWFNWYLSRKLSRINRVRYAVFAAEQALKIYEVTYPGDTRPRVAIEAAKGYIRDPSKENADAAASASYAAADAAYAADAAADAAYAADAAASASYAAYAAASAASAADAAYAAYASYAAADAAYAADAAADAAKRRVLIKILRYGLSLLG